MKKGIVVLLIAVLAAGFAFAGTFTGYAEVDFAVDLDNADWGFSNPKFGSYAFSFEFDTTKVTVGSEHQTNVWAELAASASATISHGKTYSTSALTSGTDVHGSYKASISKANIHIGEDLTISILNAGSSKNFAYHYSTNWAGAYAYDTVNGKTSKQSFYSDLSYTGYYGKALESASTGIQVTYKDFVVGFTANGNWDDETYNVFAHAETPEFKFAEDAIKVQAGGYVVLNDSDSYGGGGASASYSADILDAVIATDIALKKNNVDFAYEVLGKVDLKVVEDLPIYVNVYATPGALAGIAGYTGDYAETMKLDAKVGANYTIEVDEDIAVEIEASAEVTDALIDGREFDIYAGESATIDAFTVSLAEEYYIFAKELYISADVEYAAEKFTAYAGLGVAFQFADSDADALMTVPFKCGISSDAIIEGAELSLAWEGNNRDPYYGYMLNFADFENDKGSITAACKIAF